MHTEYNGSNLDTLPILKGAIGANNSATSDTLSGQAISLPMDAGIVFDDATTRVSASFMTTESNADDNIISCVTGLRVVSSDGSTVRATLLSLSGRGPDNTSEKTV